MDKIFLRFTVKGDNLNVYDIARDVPVPADLYEKGMVYPNKITKFLKPQKTNRWVVSLESNPSEKINSVICRLFEELHPFEKRLSEYTKKHYSILDIVIYADGIITKYNVSLTKKSTEIIKRLNSKLSITVIDF